MDCEKFIEEIEKIRIEMIGQNKKINRHEVAKANDCLYSGIWWLERMMINMNKEMRRATVTR